MVPYKRPRIRGFLLFASLLLFFFQNCSVPLSSQSPSFLERSVDLPTDSSRPPSGDSLSKSLDPGYDIIVVGGQSNAVGFGFGEHSDAYASASRDAKIFQLSRSTPLNSHEDLKVIPAHETLDHWGAWSADSTSPVGFGMGFARRYVQTYLNESSERKVLVIPAAYGGTYSYEWDEEIDPLELARGEPKPLLKDLLTRIQFALVLEGEGGKKLNNRIVALLWAQGESDVACFSENSDCHSLVPSPEAWMKRTEEMVMKLRSSFPSHQFPFLLAGFVPSWRGWPWQVASGQNHIDSFKALREKVGEVIPNAAYVPTTGLISNAEAGVRANDEVHFSAESQAGLAHRMYSKFLRLKAPLRDPFTGVDGNGTISNSVFELSTFSKYAGAVGSLKFKGQEILNSYGYGRLFQSAMYKYGMGECNNPIEAGGRSATQFSHSRLVKYSKGETHLSSTVRPAFYILKGEFSPNCPTQLKGPDFPNGPESFVYPETNEFFDDEVTFSKSIELNFQGDSQIIRHEFEVKSQVDFEIAPNIVQPHYSAYTRKLSSIFLYDIPSRQLLPNTSPQGHEVKFSNRPKILATPDGTLAVALLEDRSNGFSPIYGGNVVVFDGPNASPEASTSDLSLNYRVSTLGPRQSLKFVTYVIVGSLEEVQSKIDKLVSDK
mgnify:CR=1 FL=1|tara:strand:- start:293 stop:2272 length:1980 start_codon:yes stop_codon:yes gene_type:complete